MSSPLLRLVDANANRASEGLRVLEDIARFVTDDDDIARELRAVRHDLSQLTAPMGLELLSARDSVGDVGRESGIRAESDHTLLSAIRANAKRTEESLRVLEEHGRLASLCARIDSSTAERLRYRVYDLEKRLSGGVSRALRAAMVRGLYVVVDRQAVGDRSLVGVASEAIEGGASIIQLRDQEGHRGDVYREALEINALCMRKGVMFVMSDCADIAMAVGAAGLHVGQHDLPLTVLRKMLPVDTIVGMSCENTGDVSRAMEEGADYITVDAVFPTSQKVNHVLVGLDLLRTVRGQIGATPLVAIGGIGLDNAKAAVEAGADAVAVIGAGVMQPDVIAAAKALVATIQRAEETRGK